MITTAQIIYKQYQVLPKKVKKELVELILKENDEIYDDISLPAIKAGLKEIKLLKQGKAKTTNAREFLAEFEKELQND